MLDRDFSERLLRWANRSLMGFLGLGLSGVVVAYGLGEKTTLMAEVLGHWLIAVGALGVKVSYIARLAALDVLRPDPDGWLREAKPPSHLPTVNLGEVRAPDTQSNRKRA